jgi:hypothetical protein
VGGRAVAVIVPQVLQQGPLLHPDPEYQTAPMAMVRLTSGSQFPMSRPRPMTARRIPA